MSSNKWPVQRVVVDDAVIDAGDPWEVVDPVWWTGNIYDGVDEYDASLREYTDRQRLVFAAIWYVSEVNNGGHDQFFFNSTGIVWPDAVRAFREIGLPQVSEILIESGRRLGGEPSRDRFERQAQLEDTEADFRDLDDRFYELQNEVNIDDALAAYIKKHRSDFYFEGSIRKPQ
ncbi:MAG: DMP19 family protein [Woeseiaceae bacterium]|nr:DMP19 family protein [Woeseiaceae bacterium]